MKNKLMVAAAAAAFSVSSLVGSVAHAANIDLGFIMDRSGSVTTNYAAAMDALGDALANNIPFGGTDTYTIAVVSFASSASVVVAPTVITSQADLDGVVNTIKAQNQNGSGLTNYAAAFDTMRNAFASLGDRSLINMMTDGVPTTGGSGIPQSEALQNAGWDSLSFESIGNSNGNNLLANLGFGPGDPPDDANDLPIYTSANQITDPLTTPFVLDLPNFAAYNAVIDQKVARIITPGVVPLPAALPLLGGGVLFLGFVGRRRKKAA